MSKMKIEIWSDIACPYCYIGKRKLEKALEQFPHSDSVELVWHSYELDPDLPKKATSQSIYSYFAKKYEMTEDEARATQSNVAKLAKEAGLNYDFDNLVVANTSDALRLIKLADESSLATEAEEVLFDAYFIKGLDISDHKVLVRLGVQIGLQEDDIQKMLDSDQYRADIKKDVEFSENELNLEYIPFYLFNNKQIVQGSIPPEEYLKVLNEAYAEWEKDGVSSERGDIISGQSCSIDGVCS
ncbi:DsbA family oxidoreductase [Dysgonomonas sp. 521]|uniref:DsbA family oxidoreductase n=1 Tax=Dysgonomonas sp. 521 TaxID=2302932 RepID=UPI0013D437AF|nr:DsbA family oxidoreductase [Dysgonomonas sp. 521]NDV94478.1 DsbA family oxidoreductase [Dysgonomonas sp. 521]